MNDRAAASDLHERFGKLGYSISYGQYKDRSGYGHTAIATNILTKKKRQMKNAYSARNCMAIGELLYQKLLAEVNQ